MSDTDLPSYFTPKTLTQFGVTGTSLIASVSYASTAFDKTGMHKLWQKLPVIKQLTPVKERQVEMDLDLSCVALNAKKEVVSVVWYGKLSDDNDGICHEGDSLMGAVDFEDSLHHQEQISVHLARLPDEVCELVFFVSSYHKHPLCLANKGVLKLTDNEHSTIHKYPLNSLSKDTHALLVWHIIKQGDDFLVKAPLLPLPIPNTAPDVFISTLKTFATQHALSAS